MQKKIMKKLSLLLEFEAFFFSDDKRRNMLGKVSKKYKNQALPS